MARVSIEDCLEFMDNRFALVTVAADRTRDLMAGADPLIASKNKEAVTALREIADGLVVQKREPVVSPNTEAASAPVVNGGEAPTSVS